MSDLAAALEMIQDSDEKVDPEVMVEGASSDG